jgi:hypothetical protein
MMESMTSYSCTSIASPLTAGLVNEVVLTAEHLPPLLVQYPLFSQLSSALLRMPVHAGLT